MLRRDRDTLQVGLGADAVRLPDSEQIRRLLDVLDPHRPPASDTDPVDVAARGELDRLATAGHLEPPPQRSASREAELRDGRWALPGTVGLVAAATQTRARLEPLLGPAGLRLDDTWPRAWLVVAAGPVRRTLVDDLVRSGAPHLVVESLDGVRRVGPFVVPGRTACLRCVDAHRADRDPRYPLLVDQAATALARMPPPIEPVTDLLALAWAVRDLTAFERGTEPSTWSASVEIDAVDEPRWPVARRQWLRHPHCGCAWDDLVALP